MDHPFSKYAKPSEKQTFLTPLVHRYTCAFEWGKKCWFFGKFCVPTKCMKPKQSNQKYWSKNLAIYFHSNCQLQYIYPYCEDILKFLSANKYYEEEITTNWFCRNIAHSITFQWSHQENCMYSSYRVVWWYHYLFLMVYKNCLMIWIIVIISDFL